MFEFAEGCAVMCTYSTSIDIVCENGSRRLGRRSMDQDVPHSQFHIKSPSVIFTSSSYST